MTVHDGDEILRGAGVALWRQIDATLGAEIEGGAWRPGQQLPTEQALATRFAVNRHTIRRAIQALIQRGLVRVEQGRGMFVREEVIDYRISRRTRFTENVQPRHKPVTRQVLHADIQVPPVEIGAWLGLQDGVACLVSEQLASVGEIPVSLSTHYRPVPRFAGFNDVLAASGSVTKALAHYGVFDYVRAETRVSARLPSGAEAGLLAQAPTKPVLVAQALDTALDGQPISVNITRFVGDRIQLIFRTGEEEGLV